MLPGMIARILSFVAAMLAVFGFRPAPYETRPLFADAGFANGFTVMSMQTLNGSGVPLGNFTYNTLPVQPSWKIAQWNSGYCLWAERVPSDMYTITDGRTKTVRYNPASQSVSMRLNGANVYGGRPAGDGNWPHLLLEQSPLPGASGEDKAFYSCASDKLVLRLKIRLTDFKDTVNKEGVNAAQFLAYLYLTGVNGRDFVWFGINLFDSRCLQNTYWSKDTAGSDQMIYTVSTADTYGCGLFSLTPFGRPRVSDRWAGIELDLVPHIRAMLAKANEDGTFGRRLTASDFFIGGANIGFEIHGNYDCTIEIKDFQIVSYRAAG